MSDVNKKEKTVITEDMVERAMNTKMPGGSAAWVWLFNCEGGYFPQEKHKEWFRKILKSALYQ